MEIIKAGCILINKKTKKIGLIYRRKHNDYSFPKGHLENKESLISCALRETEEETERKCHIINNYPIGILSYTDKDNNQVEVYYYMAIDNGKTKKIIQEKDKECLKWVNYEDVQNKLSYQNLINFWNLIKNDVKKELDNE